LAKIRDGVDATGQTLYNYNVAYKTSVKDDIMAEMKKVVDAA